MLMAAHLFIGLSIKEEYSENANKLLFACAVLITIAIAISIIFLAPRMLNSAVFAEYGWQGGMPMITYNFLLLILGVVAGWKLRDKIKQVTNYLDCCFVVVNLNSFDRGFRKHTCIIPTFIPLLDGVACFPHPACCTSRIVVKPNNRPYFIETRTNFAYLWWRFYAQ